VWLAAPGPKGEPPAEEVYGKGAERGNFYAFVKPQPFLPWTCERIPYPIFPVPHPDGFASLHNVSYVGRNFVDGRWADHYYYWFAPGGSCNGPFNLWKDIHDHLPIKDFGKNDCNGGNASTHWLNVTKREPPIWRWQNLDYSSCKSPYDTSPSLETFTRSLVERAVASHKALAAEAPEVTTAAHEALEAIVTAAMRVGGHRGHPWPRVVTEAKESTLI